VDNLGTVFKIDPTTGAEAVLHSFTGGSDGDRPVAGLIDVGGTLYGTTLDGGIANRGTVFMIDPTTGAKAVLHSFRGRDGDGDRPAAGLIDVGGTLYGTTLVGGVHGGGTVFKIDPATGAEAVLHSFGGSGGRFPQAGLIHFGGRLYGTTGNGGSHGCSEGCGTVFKINPSTGAEKVLHSFTGGSDGQYPLAFAAVILDDSIPIAVGFCLIISHHLEVRLKPRATIQTDKGLAKYGELDNQLATLFTARIIERRLERFVYMAIRKR
jgi:uncharacterized repeat protein (TIGR03803 family)